MLKKLMNMKTKAKKFWITLGLGAIAAASAKEVSARVLLRRLNGETIDIENINSHITGDGSDHSNVATNTTHRTSNGNSHSSVVSNTSHRNDSSDPHGTTLTQTTLNATTVRSNSYEVGMDSGVTASGTTAISAITIQAGLVTAITFTH